MQGGEEMRGARRGSEERGKMDDLRAEKGKRGGEEDRR